MEAKVTWKQRLTFTGTSDSGFEVALGSTPEHGGNNDGFRPVELVAIGLAGCTAMDVISILQKKRQEIMNFEVQVHADRSEDHPKVFTHVTIKYLLEGHDIDPTAVERAIELSTTKYCPSHAMLRKAVEIEHTYEIKEVSTAGD
jgi:putative redox protein